jgi:DNA processing protein
MDEILLYFSLLHNGDWHKIFHSIKIKEEVNYEKLKIMKQKLTSNYITILSSNYPLAFRQLDQPPYLIFYRGDYSLINFPSKIAVIGSREASEYGFNITKSLVSDLVKANYLIVSGLAKGIDAIAHLQTLNASGKTIAIVGQGLNHIYPSENKPLYQAIETKGLLISEYPDDVLPSKHHFPNRNRLIAALANAIVITEAKTNSGTLTTVRHGLNSGKDIFCVPYPVGNSSACNLLIKQGAKLIESAIDITDEL